MIVNQQGSGWQLLTQPAHAWLAGELASAWGNNTFDPPAPFAAVTMATRLHDIGWAQWDSSPRLGDHGEPINFLDTKLSETAPIWRRAVKQVSTIDPYAALLVSMHATTIYRRRLEREIDPPEQKAEVELLSTEQRSIQQKLVGSLQNHPIYGPETAPEKLTRAYRWLRACDLLSLILCSDVMPSAGVITVYRNGESAELLDIEYRRPNLNEIHLDPSPFSSPQFELSLPSRFLLQNKFNSQGEFRAELEKSIWRSQKVTVS